jgi:uncharacterized membrane protein YcaP (DUF421 family)
VEWQQVVTRLGAGPADLVVVVVSALAIYVAVIAATRIVGLRSFSKMSAFDFAMTVAVGSIIATVATANAGVVEGVVAVGALFALQFVVAWLRHRTDVLGLVDNRPLLLMDGATILHDHLERSRVTEADLRGKLREAGVLRLDQVRAVVLETTGDISVLAGGELDPALLEDVIGSERLAS